MKSAVFTREGNIVVTRRWIAFVSIMLLTALTLAACTADPNDDTAEDDTVQGEEIASEESGDDAEESTDSATDQPRITGQNDS
jgi:hypothetical protein